MYKSEDAQRPLVTRLREGVPLGEDPWVSYHDLGPLGFVNPATGKPFSRKHLGDLMRRGEWPAATQYSANRIAWKLSELRRREQGLPVARSVRGSADAAD
jgi:hypothetical protein